MTFNLIFAIAIVAGAAFADDSCPRPAEISPCTCDGEGINCMGARTQQEIRQAFRANFKYGGVRSVWIQGTPLSDIPSDLFGTVKTQQFFVEINNVTTVDIKAFSASAKTLQVLSLFGNRIKTFPFSELNMFERLSTLNLGRNLIETIPSGAFDHKQLYTLILAQNRISTIGMNAFANLPFLGRLELGSNSLITLGPMSIALKSHSAGLQINLSANQISEVSSTAFNGADPHVIFFTSNKLQQLKNDAFGNLVTRIVNKGGFLEVSGNPFTCRGCDYNWLVLNKGPLASRLLGFTCTDRRSLMDLTKQNIGCP